MDGCITISEKPRNFITLFSFFPGNGTVALEILEDLPDVDTVIVPYGGGALTSGIGTVMKALKPNVKVITSEVDTSPQVRYITMCI